MNRISSRKKTTAPIRRMIKVRCGQRRM